MAVGVVYVYLCHMWSTEIVSFSIFLLLRKPYESSHEATQPNWLTVPLIVDSNMVFLSLDEC